MWIIEYEQQMFGPDHTLETMDKAAELKNKHMPDVLYKYRGVSQNTLEALRNDFLFSSQPQEFNDIFEGSITLQKPAIVANLYRKLYADARRRYPFLPDKVVTSHKEFIESTVQPFGGTYEEVTQDSLLSSVLTMIEELMNGRMDKDIAWIQNYARNMYNICCFSAKSNNELMWAHYADQHKGFCVGYSIKELNNDLTHLTLPVIYTKKCHVEINDWDDVDGSLCMHMLSTKSPQWSYEKEWRTFFLPNPPCHKEIMPTPSVVYLGARISDKDAGAIYEICKNKGIQVYKMMPSVEKHVLIPKIYRGT